MVELNFDVVSRNVTAFDAVPLESTPLSNLFSKNESFQNRSFFFTPWHQGEECATILIAPTNEYYPGRMQKHQELASRGYPNS